MTRTLHLIRTFRLSLWLLIASLLPQGLSATIVQETIFLNQGIFTAVDGQQFPYYAFNVAPSFNSHNAVLIMSLGDTLELRVVNRDTIQHAFQLADQTPVPVGPQDTITVYATAGTPSIMIYQDAQNAPQYSYMGAAGMIVFDDGHANGGEFYWNIKEHQSDWNQELANGNPVNWADYAPNYFTLNGRSKPDIANDASAMVTGNVGENIHIYIANTGLGRHSLHFHGYHARIIAHSHRPEMLDWSKDTFPIGSMQGMILELIPDKPGMFPVHDHNLIAITGGGYYPNGIFLMMDIQ